MSMSFDDIASMVMSGRTAVFVGAGISFQAGIPLVTEIEKELLAALGVDADDARDYQEMQMPFESTMQAALNHASSEKLFAIFNAHEPQRNHFLLARLALDIESPVPVIISTNFDTLIEQAANKLGRPLKVLKQGSDGLAGDSAENHPNLVKIHGCITNTQALGVTIKAVANEQGVLQRRDIIHSYLGSDLVDDVLVIGYSFSDKFDISPALRSLRLPVRFWVVNHTDNALINQEPLSSLPATHPLRGYEGAVLNVNTDELIEAVWRKTQSDTPVPLLYRDAEAQSQMIAWRASIESGFGSYIVPLIASTLFRNANRFEASNRYAMTSLQALDGSHQPDRESILHHTIGENFRDMSQYDFAEKHLRDAITLSRQARRMDLRAHAMKSMGVVKEDRAKLIDNAGESDKPHPPRRMAIKYYRAAANRARSVGDEELAAICEGNMGIAMKNVRNSSYRRRAFAALHNALRIARRHGDQKSVGRCYGMMASCLTLLGRKSWAIPLWKRALEASEDMADFRHIATWTANLGEDYIDMNPSEANKYIMKAKEMFIDLRMTRQAEYCDNLLDRLSLP